MFDINELRFIDELIRQYLEECNDLPLTIRNRILRLDNKILNLQNLIKENEKREFEEDKQQLKRIVK